MVFSFLAVGRRRSHEPTSPSPSVDRLSVTFAMDEFDNLIDGNKTNQL